MTHRDRADRGRYGRLLVVEVARATTSRAAWETCAREAERRLAEFEAELAAEKRWKGLQAEIERRQPPGRQPAASSRATITSATPRTAALRPAPVAADPLTAHADHLEREGYTFAAAAERRRLAEADHAARRRRVEDEVARTERLFQTLARNYGRDYAERYVEGA